MFIYLSGKIIYSEFGEIIIKLPTGTGYLLKISPASKLNVNENVEFYVLTADDEIYGFQSIEEWKVAYQIYSGGIAVKLAAEIIFELGLEKLHRALVTQDEALLNQISGLGTKSISKILQLKIPVLNLRDDDNAIKEQAKEVQYTAVEFTEKLSSLGYSRNRIVQVISKLRFAGDWGVLPLVEVVKKAIDIMEGKLEE
jgi:Holliday junction resolvasome RuvABC DNA-binding subunit